MKAALKIVAYPTTCNANIVASLSVSVTAIAESTMYFANVALLTLKLDSAISGHSNLSIVKSSSFVDLLLDDVKCVHD
jgi:hypothetical protein